MKAISLHQPWATWVALKWKTIETRTHDRFKGLVGRRIAIHAAQKIDPLGYNKYLPGKLSELDIRNIGDLVVLHRGKIVCTARVSKARWAKADELFMQTLNRQAMCEVGRKFLLFLEEIEPLNRPVPYRGRQGIFDVPDELVLS